MNGNFSAKIGARITEFMAKMNQVQAKAKQIANDIFVEIGAKTANFDRKAAEVQAKALALDGRKVDVKVDADTNPFKRALMFAEARIGEFQNKINRIATNIRAFGELAAHTITGSLTALLPAIVPLISNLGVAIANLGPMIGVVAGSTFALVGAFAAAGAGAVAFGAVAIPTIKKLFDENAKLTAEQQKAKNAFDAFKATYNEIVKATEKPVLSAFQSAMEAANRILGQLKPLFSSSAEAVARLMEQLNKSVGTPPIQGFLEYLNSSGGKMLETFGQAFGNVFKGLMSMLTAFKPLSESTAQGFLEMTQRFAEWSEGLKTSETFKSFMDYVNTNMPKIRAIFRDATAGLVYFFSAFGESSSGMMDGLVDMMARFKEWSRTLSENQGFQTFMNYVKQTTPSVLALIGNLTDFIINLGIGMAPLGAIILELVNKFLSFANGLMENNRIIGVLIAAFISFMGVALAIIPNIIALGTLFSGVGTALFNFGSKIVGFLPKISSLGATFTNLSTKALPWLARAFGLLSGPVGWAITLITTLITIGIALYQNWDSISAGLTKIWNTLKQNAVNAFGQIKDGISEMWNDTKNATSVVWNGIKSFLSGLWSGLKSAASTAFNSLKSSIETIWNGIKSTTSSIWNGVKSFLGGLWIGLKSTASAAFNALKSTIENVWNGIKGTTSSMWNGVKSFLSGLWNGLKSTATSAFNLIKSAVENAWNGVKFTTSTIWNGVKLFVAGVWEGIKMTVGTVASAMLAIVTERFNSIKDAVFSKMAEVKTNIETKWNEAQSFLASIDLAQIGRDIINGLVNGIGEKVGAVKAKVEELASNIPAWAKKMLGIHSPSRVMHAIAVWIPEGIASGIESRNSSVIRAMRGLKDNLVQFTEDMNAEIAKLSKEEATELAKIEEDKLKDIEQIRKKAIDKKRSLTAEEYAEIGAIESKAAAESLETTAKYEAERLSLRESYNSRLIDSVKSYISQKKELEQLSLVNEAKLWEESTKLFNVGTEEKRRAQLAYRDSLQAIYSELETINQNYLDQVTKINEDLKAAEEELSKAYSDEFDKRYSDLLNFSGLFDEFKKNIEVTGSGLLSNLKTQVDGFKEWQVAIDELSKRAIDQGLLEELRQMGPQALGELQALNSLTDAQLSEYSSLYKEKSALARQQTETELESMRLKTDSQLEELRKAADKQLKALQKDWERDIKNVTQTTKNELSSLQDIGQQAGQGLLNGLSSMEGPLVAKATEIANSIKAAMQSALDIHSPSRWADKFIGRNFVAGIINGFSAMTSELEKATANLADVMQSEFSVADLVGAGSGEIGSIRHDMDRKIEVNVKVEQTDALASGGGVHQEVHLHSPKHLSPSENARKLKRVAEDLALKNR